jgi:hypothetical protein
MDGAIRKALARRNDTTAGECPGENVLAAYLETRLGEAERQTVERHASGCTSCQEIIGLALRLSDPEAQPVTGDAEASSRKRILFHVSLPMSALAMIVLALVAGVLFYRIVRESSRIPAAPQTAELHPPAQAEGISAAKTPEKNIPQEKLAVREQLQAVSEEKAKGSALKSADRAGRVSQPAKDSVIAREPAARKIPSQEVAKTEPAEENKVGREQTVLPQPPIEAVATLAMPLTETKDGSIAVDRRGGIATVAGEYKPADSFSASRAELSRTKPPSAQRAAAMNLQPVALGPAFAPRDAVVNIAALIPSARGKLAEKKIRDRIFYLNSGYWIDAQCPQHVSADFADVRSDSPEFDQILKSMPELEKTRPAIVYWNGRNLVLR